jgi:hypothetical protein
MPGIATSPVEIVQLSRFGFWLAVGDAEYFLDFTHFPWFRAATIEAICEVDEVAPDHFYWPSLDIDLDLDAIRSPEKYPLVYQG